MKKRGETIKLVWSAQWSEKAKECLKQLDFTAQERILIKLEQAKELPYHYFERLVGIEGWRLRVGDYRIIAKIEETTKTIRIYTVGHRKNIYKS